ncbi:MAG: Alpha-L-rhamnosidase N-terminal domain [Bacteroidetes bacterium]|nr:Alpha-L-rhamnosidase N-terminal domain [Bacteroidota bacterium]
MNKQRVFSLIIIGLLLPLSMWAKVDITYLRTEQMVNPMGIDAETPRLSWRLVSSERNVMQRAYHILVASSLEKLNKGEGDLWDSGKVNSDASIWVSYAGTPLKSNVRCYWRVKSYTTRGETAWSEPAHWSMGLFSENNWKGQWIGADKAFPWDSEAQWSRLSARYLRKEFKLAKKVKQATVHIAGLGMYELFINGEKIGDQVLAPAPTDYRKTVLYNSFDVTSMLKAENAIGVTLGNGRFYTMRQNYKPYKIATFGYPKMRLNLIVEYSDGSKETIVSDASWKLTADGPIRSNNEYDGEDYDARKELKGWATAGYDDSQWEKAQRVSIPTGTLRAAMAPNMKVMETIKPLSIKKVEGKCILDMGQNMVGRIRMKIKGNAGDSIRLRFAELLQKNGELYVRNLRDARVTDTYIVRGDEAGVQWSPRFVYHGFRYVEVSGYSNAQLSDFVGEVVNDEMETLGSFETSNSILNQIYKNAYWGIRGNYKGLPVDCPQRNERQPWLGDRAIGSLGESFVFENGPLYAKWMDDIREAQREDGCIPDVAPAYWNYYSDNMTWPSALLLSSDMIYTQFGNMKPIVKNYPAMKLWLSHMKKEYMTEDYIVTKDKYGDWCVPPESLELIHSKDPNRQTDGQLIATAYYYKMLSLMTRFANLQGFKEDATGFDALAAKVKAAFNKKFLAVKSETSRVPGHLLYPDSIYYGNNTVTANILPLAFEMVPQEYVEEVSKNVITTIITTNNGQISTGVIGVQWLMRELSKMGRADIAYLLASNKKYPSWGYMVEQSATTIWELWNGNTANPEMNSGNHVMLLGDLIPWCYENLAGIRSSREEVAFKHIVLRPDFDIQDLSKVDASYMTPYGKVVSRWKKNLMQLEWEVEIPANTTAEVYLPDGKEEEIGSGSYHYSVKIPTRDKAILTDEFLYEETSFPECHASTIAEMPNGDLVASFFGGTKERNPDCCIWVCRKEKGSDKWTDPMLAADGVFSPSERKACWNPVLFQIPGGDLLLFYKIGLKVSDWSGWLVRSKDGGKTWSKREPLPEGFLGPVKNKPELINGKIICPSSTEGSGGWQVHFEISDDLGKTWRMVGPISASEAVLTIDANMKEDPEAGENFKNTGKVVQAIQPSILKLKDGRLQVLCRTRNGKLATSWSSDDGETWTPLTLLYVPNNNSGTDAVTLKDGRHILIYNNFGTLPGTPKGVRTPLNIALSKDGVKWEPKLTLEDSPISQYSYPAIIQGKDGKIHAIYTWRRQRIKYQCIDPEKL